jgi:hypothetical protein
MPPTGLKNPAHEFMWRVNPCSPLRPSALPMVFHELVQQCESLAEACLTCHGIFPSPSASSSALASCRSAVSKPSVNQP